MEEKYKKLLKQYSEIGQAHIFRFWQELNPEQKRSLLKQVEEIDPALLNYFIKQVKNSSDTAFEYGSLTPPDLVTLSERQTRDAKAVRLGEKALRQGKVAAFLVAGGQGTRLGYDGAKGKYPVTPVRSKSLFQVHSEKIKAVGKKFGKPIPWYIMTSETNHDETMRFFEENAWFGLDPRQVSFFSQEMIPALDKNGKLILDAKDHIFKNPNGHGGSLKALWKSGAIQEMKSNGIEYVFYFQVDNALVQMCDPAFIGYHIMEKSDMSSVVIRKTDPEEKVGIICKIDGKTGVVEYSDLRKEDMYARDDSGSLRNWAGSIAVHMINVAFVEQENKDGFKLPYHIANKSIPFLDENGVLTRPENKNGIKFETFVFDALLDTKKSFTVEEDRKREFSPLKNKDGVDSPQTVKRDLCNYYGDMLEYCGFQVPRDAQNNVCIDVEISPLFAMDKQELFDKKAQLGEIKNGLYLGD